MTSQLKTIKSSYLWAGGIAAAIILWVASGALTGNGAQEKAPPLTETSNANEAAPVQVRARKITLSDRTTDLVMRGRTKAQSRVEVKAEVGGQVSRIAVEKGQAVRAGDVMCELDVGAKAAQNDQAQARLRQAQLEYDAAAAMGRKGNRSETAVAGAKASLEAAQADARAAEWALLKTRIVAPFDGTVDDRMVETGDLMQPGMTCALVIDPDPFLIIGSVSEREVGLIQAGDAGSARLVTGETVSGTVSFVARSADPATRTFRVEMTVPNPDFTLRDGVTAEMKVGVKSVPAVKVSPAILSLDDKGTVGVKLVVDGKARFTPVTIIGDGGDGMWIAGLPPEAVLIVVGQDYVKDGEPVTPVLEEPATAAATGQAG
jgi:membrane fusion protein, multidrug efflux system